MVPKPGFEPGRGHPRKTLKLARVNRLLWWSLRSDRAQRLALLGPVQRQVVEQPIEREGGRLSALENRLDDERVQCDVCPRFCKLQEGQRGMCFVRACENGQVVLTTYGRSSGFCCASPKLVTHFTIARFRGSNLDLRFRQWDTDELSAFLDKEDRRSGGMRLDYHWLLYWNGRLRNNDRDIGIFGKAKD